MLPDAIGEDDAPDGHAVLALEEGRLRLETVSRGLPVRA